MRLSWTKPHGQEAVVRYDVYRAESDETAERLNSATGPNYRDDVVVGGRRYRYHVVAYDASGRRGLPSNPVEVAIPEPALPRTVPADA